MQPWLIFFVCLLELNKQFYITSPFILNIMKQIIHLYSLINV